MRFHLECDVLLSLIHVVNDLTGFSRLDRYIELLINKRDYFERSVKKTLEKNCLSLVRMTENLSIRISRPEIRYLILGYYVN